MNWPAPWLMTVIIGVSLVAVVYLWGETFQVTLWGRAVARRSSPSAHLVLELRDPPPQPIAPHATVERVPSEKVV